MYDFSKLKFRKSRFLKILDTLIPFSASGAQALWCQETQPANPFRGSSSLAGGRAKLAATWPKRDLSSEVNSRSRCTRFEECFLFDFDVARSEIIIKSSFETHHIENKWWCCCRRRWRRRDEKIGERRKVEIVDKVAVKHVISYLYFCAWNS
jgi:hypothetical protein